MKPDRFRPDAALLPLMPAEMREAFGPRLSLAEFIGLVEQRPLPEWQVRLCDQIEANQRALKLPPSRLPR